MASLRTTILVFFVPLALATIGVRIQEVTREGNNVRFLCREHLLDGTTSDVPNPTFSLNSSLDVTTLLEERGLAYNYDSVSGVFSFDVQQDIEGCYYCGNSTSLSSNCETIVAYPDRQDIPTRYEVHVGQPVRLLNGVGEGALASYYDVQWRKGFTLLTETDGISYERGDDLSLFFESVRMSDSGTYRPKVEVHGEYVVKPDVQIDLVVYSSPQINREPTSIVAVQGSGVHRSVSFHCVASGGPNLRVSWIQNMNKNLTSMPDPRYLVTAASASDTVNSTLVIQNATHLDSGSFHCVAYIMDRVDGSPFVIIANATLTVLDTKFQLQTRVTQEKELQIWINLHAPLPDPVRAMVCFTSTEDKEIQRHYETSSSQTNSTALFFLLHFPDIPEDVRDSSFKVQVALKAGVTEGPLVPISLEQADTRNINEPTEDSCKEDTTKIIIITAGGVLAAIVLLVAASVITFGCYKCRVRVERRKARCNIPDGRFEDAKKRIDELVEKIEKVITDTTITDGQRKELKKVLKSNLTHWQGFIKGDGTDEEVASL